MLFTCLITLVLGLKIFVTFTAASACFFPDAWTVSAECPEEDNSITLWRIVHLALVEFSSLAGQSLDYGSENQIQENTFDSQNFFYRFFYSYFLSS